ncbi:MAG: S46 family peptidase [Bacteroidia bacterium]|nr:S46 family peptidase [Bacteroidia bacterium]
MKRIFALFTLSIIMMTQVAKADEGMWLLSMLDKMNFKDMEAKGLRLTKEQLYSINNSSLKDASIWFNNGCTGEFVSSEGLVLTNHHCGYDAIAGLSTTADNILDNGFWAKDKGAEKVPHSSMSVTRVVRVDDITDQVLAQIKGVEEKDRAKKLREIFKDLETKATEGTHFEATSREMFKGNAYYLFVMEKFTDIRLVGTPPQNIGKFGGETDNWMWPRHTGDFSMFRVYVGNDNKPAKYNATNVPYKPLKHLSVSLKGFKEGDFAMIIGFPGRTNRYEFSQGIALATDIVDPNIVNLRAIRLKAWKEQMIQDDATRLLLSSSYASVANYWKYFDGEAEQLKRNKVFEKKAGEEKAFALWASTRDEYKTLLYDIDQTYTEYKPYSLQATYMRECIGAPGIIQNSSMGFALESLYKKRAEVAASKELSKEAKMKELSSIDSNINVLCKTNIERLASISYNDRIIVADKKIFAGMLMMYFKNIPSDQWTADFKKLASKIKNGNAEIIFAKYTDMVFAKSIFASKEKIEAFMKKPNYKKLLSDPAFAFYKSHVDNYNANFKTKIEDFYSKSNALGRKYIKGLMEMAPNRYYYPDANSCQRLTYGTIRSYNPKDGVHYDYITTLDGVMEKYIPGDYEFDLPQGLIDLYKKADYGRYKMENGKLPVAFLSDNDITGGNSGSPVMDGDGNLIGIAFDGNWEAMSGNIDFDQKYKRTISVDIRYVLWLIDKFGGAPHIVNEMTIIE